MPRLKIWDGTNNMWQYVDSSAYITSSYTTNSTSASYALSASFIGDGTDHYVPFWKNNTLTGSSGIYNTGSKIGIGVIEAPGDVGVKNRLYSNLTVYNDAQFGDYYVNWYLGRAVSPLSSSALLLIPLPDALSGQDIAFMNGVLNINRGDVLSNVRNQQYHLNFGYSYSSASYYASITPISYNPIGVAITTYPNVISFNYNGSKYVGLDFYFMSQLFTGDAFLTFTGNYCNRINSQTASIIPTTNITDVQTIKNYIGVANGIFLSGSNSNNYNIGIKKTSPEESLDVNGNIKGFVGKFTSISSSGNITASGALLNGDSSINGNLYVNGTGIFLSSSVFYITSSTLVVDDNIITLNALSPFKRYAGLEMYDSGSDALANLLWDSLGNYFFVSSSESGAAFSRQLICGPNDEGNLTTGYFPKSNGRNNIVDSILFETGSSKIGLGTITPSSIFNVYSNVAGNGITVNTYGNTASFSTSSGSFPRGFGLGVLSGLTYSSNVTLSNSAWNGKFGGHLGIWSDVNYGSENATNAVSYTSMIRGSGNGYSIGYFGDLRNVTNGTRYGILTVGDQFNHIDGNLSIGSGVTSSFSSSIIASNVNGFGNHYTNLNLGVANTPISASTLLLIPCPDASSGQDLAMMNGVLSIQRGNTGATARNQEYHLSFGYAFSSASYYASITPLSANPITSGARNTYPSITRFTYNGQNYLGLSLNNMSALATPTATFTFNGTYINSINTQSAGIVETTSITPISTVKDYLSFGDIIHVSGSSPTNYRVGIATSSPQETLHVQGNISCSNLIGTASYASSGRSFVLQMQTNGTATLASSTTYYLSTICNLPSTTFANEKIEMPSGAYLKRLVIHTRCAQTGSNNVAINYYITDGTTDVANVPVYLTSSVNVYNSATANTFYSQSQFISLKIVTPAWTPTAPTSQQHSAIAYFES